MTDDGPVYHALSVHLSRAKLITRFDDLLAVAKFSKSGVYKKVSEGSTLIFVDTWISLKHSVGLVERSPHAKTQIISSIRFDRTPTCDRHRHGHTGRLKMHDLKIQDWKMTDNS